MSMETMPGRIDDDKTPPGAFTTLSGAPAGFADQIEGEASGYTPAALAPGNSTVKVEHWDQAWYMGSLTPGLGKIVQTDTIQKYIDHAEHQNILTGAW